MNIYVTRHVLKAGHIEQQLGEIGVDGFMRTEKEWFYKCHWHTSLEAAKADAEKMRLVKINELQREIVRLKGLTFE